MWQEPWDTWSAAADPRAPREAATNVLPQTQACNGNGGGSQRGVPPAGGCGGGGRDRAGQRRSGALPAPTAHGTPPCLGGPVGLLATANSTEARAAVPSPPRACSYHHCRGRLTGKQRQAMNPAPRVPRGGLKSRGRARRVWALGCPHRGGGESGRPPKWPIVCHHRAMAIMQPVHTMMV